MATRIRLKRTGAKHNAHFRIVIIDQRSRRDGRTVEEIGHYDPNTDPATVVVNQDRALHWLLVGAVPSETVTSLFQRVGVFEAAQAAGYKAKPKGRSGPKAPAEASE